MCLCVLISSLYVFISSLLCIYKQLHTPGWNGRLHYKVLYVGVENLDEAKVEQRSLNKHPGEGCQKEVVKKRCHYDAHVVIGRGSDASKKDDVDNEQSQRQAEEDLLPARPSQWPG